MFIVGCVSEKLMNLNLRAFFQLNLFVIITLCAMIQITKLQLRNAVDPVSILGDPNIWGWSIHLTSIEVRRSETN